MIDFERSSLILHRLAKSFSGRNAERLARAKANEAFMRLTFKRFYTDLPLVALNAVLTKFGFRVVTYTEKHFSGDRQDISFQVGPNSVLYLDWEYVSSTNSYKLKAHIS